MFSWRVIAKIACNISGTFMFGTSHGSNAQTYQMVTMDGKLLTLRLKSQAMVTITYSLNCAKHRWSYFLILSFTRINRFWLVLVLFPYFIFYQNQSFLVGLVHFIRALWEGNRFCLLNCCGSVSSCLFGRKPIFVGWFGSVYLCPIGRKPVLLVWLCSFLSRPIGRKLVLQNLLHSQTCVPVQFDRPEISHYFEY